MRGRLTFAFVAVTVTLLLAGLLVRSFATGDRLRAHESDELDRQADRLVAALVALDAADADVDADLLATQIGVDQRLEVSLPERPTVAVEGVEYAAAPRHVLRATREVGEGGRLVLSESDEDVNDLLGEDRRSILWLVLVVGVLAALVGYVLARILSAPFLKLTSAARQLGRGRFDLDLPRTRIPEAQAIASALHGSAGQLQERLAGEHLFAEHASHMLRTPLTGLRLDLEDLATREDLPEDVRSIAGHAVSRIEHMDEVAGELVALSRTNSLVASAKVPLSELAASCAQTWANHLHAEGRAVTAAMEGEIATTYTPGPIEYVLDMLLLDVERRGAGPVRMTFEAADDGHLTVTVRTGRGRRDHADDRTIGQAKAVVTALGGRFRGEDPADGYTVLLPRR